MNQARLDIAASALPEVLPAITTMCGLRIIRSLKGRGGVVSLLVEGANVPDNTGGITILVARNETGASVKIEAVEY